jgi:hypothetical protein
MKKYAIVVALLFCFVQNSNALIKNSLTQKNYLQTKKWGEFLERESPWSFGGMFGLNFIPKGYSFSMFPMLTYKARDRWFLGVSSGAYFISQVEELYNPNKAALEDVRFNSFYFDNSVFARFFFARLLFLQAEPGIVSFENFESVYFDNSTNAFKIEKKWKTVPYVQMGGGVIIPFSEKSYMIIRCLYDVLQKEDSPYKGLPIIRGGFNIGI